MAVEIVLRSEGDGHLVKQYLRDPKQFGLGILPSHPYFKLLGCLVFVSAMSPPSDIVCANFDISACSVLERRLVKRLNDVVLN
jgi:hypothetical protein